MVLNSDSIYMPSCLSYNIFLIVKLLLTWPWYALKTLLEILKELRGFIIRLDKQYFNAARTLNWTGNHLCILRPIPAHSEWITGGLSQFCRDPILNTDRKSFSGAKKAFIFHGFFLCPLWSSTQSNFERTTSYHKDDGNGNLGLFLFIKKEPWAWKPYHSTF